MTELSFRHRDGELIDAPTVASTRVKNEFGATDRGRRAQADLRA